MANTTSQIKIVFDGNARGVVAAAAEARAAISGLNKEGSKLSKFGDAGAAALGKVVKGMAALGTAGSAVQVIGGTAAAVGQLAPAALVLPGALLGATAAFSSLKLATLGFGDAIGAALLGDMKTFEQITGSMAPEAASAAKGIADFTDELKKSVQADFWGKFNTDVGNLGGTYLPILKRGLGDTAGAFGDMFVSALKAANTPFFSGSVNAVLDDTSGMLKNMKTALGDALTGFVGLGKVGTSYLPGLGKAIDDVAAKFKNWVTTGVNDGSIKAMIDTALKGFRDLKDVVVNVGSILGSVFKGLAGDMSSPLSSLKELTGQLAAFLKTAAAQEGLKALGEVLRTCADVMRNVLMAALQEIAPALVDAAPGAKALATAIGDFLVSAIHTVGPLIQGLATFLSANEGTIRVLTPAVLGLVTAVKALKVFNEIKTFVTGAVTALSSFTTSASKAGIEAEGAATKTGKFHGKLGLIKGLGAAAVLAGIATGLSEIDKNSGGAADGLERGSVALGKFTTAASTLDLGFFIRQFVDEVKFGEVVWAQFKNQVSGFKLTPIEFQVDTGPGRLALRKLMGEINDAAPTVNINGNTNPAAFAYREILAEIADGKSEIIIDGQPVPAQEALARVKTLIDTSVGTVTVNGKTVPATEALKDLIGRANAAVGTITIEGNRDPATGKITQAVKFADGSKGTITVDGNPIPAQGQTTRAVTFANGSKGTITIDGNHAPADGKINATVTYANGRTGIIQVDASVSQANSAINGLVTNWNGRHINLIVTTTGSGGIASAGRLATGGPVYGPGTGTSDTAGLFALSNGEHVLTAREVQLMGGQGAVLAMRRALHGGRVPRLASGGRAASGGAISSSGGLATSVEVTPEIRVFIGDQELTSLVRTEIAQSHRSTARRVAAGAGASF